MVDNHSLMICFAQAVSVVSYRAPESSLRPILRLTFRWLTLACDISLFALAMMIHQLMLAGIILSESLVQRAVSDF